MMEGASLGIADPVPKGGASGQAASVNADKLDLAARRLVHHYFGGDHTCESLHPFIDELRRACCIPISEFEGGA